MSSTTLETSLPRPERLPAISRVLGGRLSFLRRVRVMTLIGGLGVIFWILVALLAPLIAPYSYTEFHMQYSLQPPSAQFLLGTDQFGRDILSRIIMGSRDILVLAPLSTGAGVILGVIVGSVAGYYGRLVDEILMRLVDAMLSFPSLLLAMLVVGLLGSTPFNLIMTVAFLFMPRVARVVRSVVLEIKTKEYVEAALLRGESSLYIMFREILPNCLPPIIVEGSVRVSYAIFLIASLGFLGLGQPPPSPDWGMQVSEGRGFILYAPWVALVPSVAIATFIIALNLLTDGIRQQAELQGTLG